MRAILLVIAAATAMAVAAARADSQPNERQHLNINGEWRFQIGDHPGAEQPNFDDAAWQHIGLPHSFGTPYFASPDFYVGYGWYRKHFNVPSAAAGKRISIEFEAAFQDAEVFINGKRIGQHQGGYTGFQFDVTDAITPGDNLLAVRLNNLWNPRLTPRAGEHVFNGGIYRDVYLVIQDPIHVAWCGTAVTSKDVSNESATVNIKTEVENAWPQEQTIALIQSIVDADGKVVAEMNTTVNVPAKGAVTSEQTSPPIPNPRLWHPDHPNLYALKTTLKRQDTVLDETQISFGIRSLKWTADKGFFLNGEHLYLKGANVHQDHAGWGDAVTNAGFERDVKMVKDAGFNFIRGSHYPHDPAFLDACDRQGILFWSENAFWGLGGTQPDGYWNASAYPVNPDDQPEFEASVKQQLAEMIRIHRNHPSVIAWSMCNEAFFSDKSVIPNLKRFLGDLVTYTHTLDDTRSAAIGGAQRPLDANRIDLVGDVAGYNGDGATIKIFRDPGVPSLVSEYGSVFSNRPGKYDPGWGDLAKEASQPPPAWRGGQAIWCAFDHGSIAGANLGKMGIIDYSRLPKRAWFWYRNEYTKVPPPTWPKPGTPARLKLEASKQTNIATDGTDDTHLIVTVQDASGTAISNSPPVELSIASGPGEFPTGPSIQFEEKSDIPILDGQAAIEFRSYYAGKTVIRATSPGLESADLTLSFDGPVEYAERSTPPTQPRPYVRFSKKGKPNIPQTFGRDNPTFASSANADHIAGLAADGNPKTFWQPAADDTSPSWTLFMEKLVAISAVKIRFAQEGVYQYTVEVSDDKATWRPIADASKNDAKESTRQITVPRGTNGSYVRISFVSNGTGPSPKLGEVEVTGILQVEKR